MNIRRILVPTAYDAASKPALAYAKCLANKLGSTIELVHAWELPAELSPTRLTRHQDAEVGSPFSVGREREAHAMAVFVDENRQGHPALQGCVELGATADAIVEVASRGYDLVVMSTHGRTGLAAVWTRSVAETVVRLAPCAVLTVHADMGTQLDFEPVELVAGQIQA